MDGLRPAPVTHTLGGMKREDRNETPAGGRLRETPGAGTASRDGVDVTLIRWFLGLSPSERLGALQRNVDARAPGAAA